MVRAILDHGVIRPLDPIPASWSDGLELRVEATIADNDVEAIRQWAEDLTINRTGLTMQDYESLQGFLDEDDRDQKAAARRIMESE